MKFRTFSEKSTVTNGIVIFFLTAFLCAIGSHLRLPMVLSLFWVVNAVIAGLFIRKPWLHTPLNYLFCYGGMVANDLFFSGWEMESFTINIANIIFIFICACALNRYPPYTQGKANLRHVMLIFPVCLLAALLCGIWGALASGGNNDRMAFLLSVGDWSSEQFSTGLLLLPLILTFNIKSHYHWRLHAVLPMGAVIILMLAGIMLGGPGSLALSLPGLIWCALALPISVTCLMTCLCGVAEIMLIYTNVIRVNSGFLPSEVTPLISVRLGIAALALTPYMVAASMEAIRELNRQLAMRANYDFLTRLLSRAGLFDSLARQPFRAGKTMGLILLDVDFFKQINDNYGHDGGDQVLREISRRLTASADPSVRLSRFGGEEFAAVLFGCDIPALYRQAEALRREISEKPFVLAQGELSVSVSLGTALEVAEGHMNWTAVMNRLVSQADRNLYTSKRNGRNRTTPAWQEPDRQVQSQRG